MELYYHRIYFWTCRFLGFPLELDDETGSCYISQPSAIYSLFLVTVFAVFSLTFGVSNLEDLHHEVYIVISPFHRSVGWFQTQYNCYMTSGLLLLMIILRKRIAKVLNNRRELYNQLNTIYSEIQLESYNTVFRTQLLILWTILVIKTTNLCISMGNSFYEQFNLHSVATLYQLQFPMVFITLVNNLFLETVAFLIIFIKKLRRALVKGITEMPVNVQRGCQLSDLFDEMAEQYDLIFGHKCSLRRMISLGMVLLSVQRFIDMIIRMFYIYSTFNGYYTAGVSFDYKLAVCHLVDLLVTLVELSLISRVCENLLEEVKLSSVL